MPPSTTAPWNMESSASASPAACARSSRPTSRVSRGARPEPHAATNTNPNSFTCSRYPKMTSARASTSRHRLVRIGLVVVLGAEVGDEVITLRVAERDLQLHELDEQVVLRVQAFLRHRRLPVEAQPLLDARHAGAVREVHEQREVEDARRREDRVAAQEVHLDLHRVVEPPADVDVVPAFLRVAAGRVVVDADDVADVAVEVRVLVGLEDRVDHAELRHFLRLERLGVVEDLAVAVTEDVRRVPALEAEHARLEAGREDRLHQGLARLEVLAGDRHALLARELEQRGRIERQVRRAVGVRDAHLEARVRVDLRRRDVVVRRLQARLELLERAVDLGRLAVDLGRAAPDGDETIAAVLFLERLEGLEVLRLEDTGLDGRLVGVLGEDVPAAEADVIELRERDVLLDRGRVTVRALAEPDVAELRERADRLAETFANR